MLDISSMRSILRSTHYFPRNQMSLASFLKKAREHTGLSLRAVEEGTGISNAYVSQLEGGKIAGPSPKILHRLCELYDVPYVEAMILAGYAPANKQVAQGRMRKPSRFEDLTSDETAALEEYLTFLRSRGARRP